MTKTCVLYVCAQDKLGPKFGEILTRFKDTLERDFWSWVFLWSQVSPMEPRLKFFKNI
jgi:hypothetical protein